MSDHIDIETAIADVAKKYWQRLAHEHRSNVLEPAVTKLQDRFGEYAMSGRKSNAQKVYTAIKKRNEAEDVQALLDRAAADGPKLVKDNK